MSSITNKVRNPGSASRLEQSNEKHNQVDFKMVTFSLAGKDYGIDIMKVKEIARFVNFTYVPNTPAYVRGVYNLRGEIISIIDLRALFNLSFQQKARNEEESGLILRLDSNLIGVVVDRIDKVVGINSEHIQPPHPIFGDINIKYISGVVENEGRLYIILDVERVLGKQIESPQEISKPKFESPVASVTMERAVSRGMDKKSESDTDQYKTFVAEALAALAGYHVGSVNDEWFHQRFAQWQETRNGKQIQLRTREDASSFLESFYSPFTGQLWGQEYFRSVMETIPDGMGKIISVWNPGCGRGFETYCLAVAMRMKYPEAQIKIWASDKDLLSISSAPNLVFNAREVPEFYKEYMTEGKDGLSFNQKIKDSILFEYHDIINYHGLPPMNMIFSRDVVSFMSVEQREKWFEDLNEVLKKDGCIILGSNEKPENAFGWELQRHEHMFVACKR